MTTGRSTLEQAKDAASALTERVEPKMSDVADTVVGTIKQAAAALEGSAEPLVSHPKHGNRSRKMAGLTMLALLATVIAVVAVRRRS